MFSNPLIATLLGAALGGLFVSGGDEPDKTNTDARESVYESEDREEENRV